MGKKMHASGKSQENVIPEVVGIPFARRTRIKQCKTVKVCAEDLPRTQHEMKSGYKQDVSKMWTA